LHILDQLGLDLFEQMRELAGDGRRYTEGGLVA